VAIIGLNKANRVSKKNTRYLQDGTK